MDASNSCAFHTLRGYWPVRRALSALLSFALGQFSPFLSTQVHKLCAAGMRKRGALIVPGRSRPFCSSVSASWSGPMRTPTHYSSSSCISPPHDWRSLILHLQVPASARNWLPGYILPSFTSGTVQPSSQFSSYQASKCSARTALQGTHCAAPSSDSTFRPSRRYHYPTLAGPCVAHVPAWLMTSCL